MSFSVRSVVRLFVFLCIMDVVLSLVGMRLGATESNPIMQLFMNRGTPTFVVAKLGLDFLGAAFLVLVSHVQRARYALLFACVVMGLLVIYEVVGVTVALLVT